MQATRVASVEIFKNWSNWYKI